MGHEREGLGGAPTSSDARKFTLDEARWELARQECMERGHDFDVVVVFTGDPVNVFCSRCGGSWSIAPLTGGESAD